MTMQYFIIVALTCITILATAQASELPKDQKQYQKTQQKNIAAKILVQNPQLETYFNEGQCLSCHGINQLQGLFIETKQKH
jgi:integral membrane sensor domain MASE1